MPQIALPRSLDIAAVTTVAGELERALALGDVVVDAAAVVKLDAAGLQLLCVLANAARTQGTKLDWKNVPAVLDDGARTLALTEALGWPSTRSQENR